MPIPNLLALAALVAWFVSCVWVFLDASVRVWTNPALTEGFHWPRLDRPWKWVVAVVLLWPVMFPAYVYKRVYAPRKPPRTPPDGVVQRLVSRLARANAR